jgi:hypothetical protein
MLVLSRKLGERMVVPLPSTQGNGRIESNLPTERPFMSDNHGASCNRDSLLENFAAELTSAAYCTALRHGMRGSWLDLQLGLWRVLAETVKKGTREWPPAGSAHKRKVWRESLLVDLTEGAFHIALTNGIKGFPLEVELDLYRAFRSVIRRVGQEAPRRPIITSVRNS